MDTLVTHNARKNDLSDLVSITINKHYRDLSILVNFVELRSFFERFLIIFALQKNNYVVAHAATYLNIRRTTLVEKMRKYGITRSTHLPPLDAAIKCVLADIFLQNPPNKCDLKEAISSFERRMILSALSQNGNSTTLSGHALGIKRTTLCEMFKRLGIPVDDLRAENVDQTDVHTLKVATSVSALSASATSALHESAKKLGIAPRSLQLRLQKCGTTISQIHRRVCWLQFMER